MIPKALPALPIWLSHGSLVPAVITVPDDLGTFQSAYRPGWEEGPWADACLEDPSDVPVLSKSPSNVHRDLPGVKNRPWLHMAFPDQPVPFASLFSPHHLVFGHVSASQPLGTWAQVWFWSIDWPLLHAGLNWVNTSRIFRLGIKSATGEKWAMALHLLFSWIKGKTLSLSWPNPSSRPDSPTHPSHWLGGSTHSEMGLKLSLPLRADLTPTSPVWLSLQSLQHTGLSIHLTDFLGCSPLASHFFPGYFISLDLIYKIVPLAHPSRLKVSHWLVI